jgi:hypothetical protein
MSLNLPKNGRKEKQEEAKSAAGAEILRVPIHHRCKQTNKQRATNNTKNKQLFVLTSLAAHD